MERRGLTSRRCPKCGGRLVPVLSPVKGSHQVCMDCGALRIKLESVVLTKDYIDFPVKALPTAAEGRLAYDLATAEMKYYDGTAWQAFYAPPAPSLWHADDDADKIYKLNQEGSIIISFTSPCAVPYGIGYDVDGCVWNCDLYRKFIKMNQSGSVIKVFGTPWSEPYGLTLQKDGCIWHSDYLTDKIYRLNRTGGIITSFAAPSGAPLGIGLDRDGCIWNGDSRADKIYKLNQSGSIVTSFVSPGALPTGIETEDAPL